METTWDFLKRNSAKTRSRASSYTLKRLKQKRIRLAISSILRKTFWSTIFLTDVIIIWDLFFNNAEWTIWLLLSTGL